MKTKAIICGVVVAAISSLVMSQAHAQGQDIPAVKVISTDQSDMIKVIYAYNAVSPVKIKFTNAEGLLFEEKLKGKGLERGFMKRYNVEEIKGDIFWVEIESQELSVKFKVTPSKTEKLSSQLEKVTHNFPAIALN
jgi:Flp pilus assembly protein CpaB